MAKEWKAHEYRDDDKGLKFPEAKVCPIHGKYYGKFCLKCKMGEFVTIK